MACLVSITFSIPLSASHILAFANEVPLRKSALVSFRSQRTSGTATKPSASCSTNGVVSSLNRSCQHLLTTPPKHLFEILCRHITVHSCSHITIFGYWVGPDVDDGWGYVEAFVNQIT